MLAAEYFKECARLIERLEESQLDKIEEAAELIAQAVNEGHTLYAWGGPHSSLPVQDIFWRAGGLALVNPLFTHGLSLEVGPIYMTTFLERVEGAGAEFFGQVGAEAGDAIILISTSGRNPFPIEMAKSAKEAGLRVIGVTSMAYSSSVSSRHPSGKKMYEFCDVVLDNLTVPGDAILKDDRLPQRVGPTSGWIGCLLLQALMAETAERLAEMGVVPPIYYALNLDGQEDYLEYLDGLRQKYGTRYGGIYSPNRKI
jgi:uncharacterized phosphosugar-binding protein